MSTTQPTTPMLFGDLLATARAHWVRAMSSALASRGFDGYRRSDALAMRLTSRDPLTLGEFSRRLGVSRQVGKQVADGLARRGFASLVRPDVDRRRVEIHLTNRGHAYALAVIDVVHDLNARLESSSDAASLLAARTVLHTIIEMHRHVNLPA